MFLSAVDDPVLRYAGFGIIAPFVNQVALGLIGADDFQGQIGARPEAILATGVGRDRTRRRSGSRNLPGRMRSRSAANRTFPPWAR